MKTGEYMRSWNIIFEDFERKYPDVFEQTIDWYTYDKGSNRIVVILNDGSRYVYNFITSTLNKLYPDNEFKRCRNEEEYRMAFANNLKFKMMERFISQNELCKMTGISQVSMSNYMNGKSSPSRYSLYKIGMALGCPTEELNGEF